MQEKEKLRFLHSHHLAELPRLSEPERTELRNSMTENGILVPLIVCGGNVLDGRERLEIAKELEWDRVPVCRVSPMAREQETRLTIEINLRRRQLTQEQKRVLLSTYLKSAPQESTRVVAGRLGVSQSLVSKVRRELPVEYKNSTAIIGKDRKQYRPDAKRGPPGKISVTELWDELESTLDALENVKSLQEARELATSLRAAISTLRNKLNEKPS